ncbi:hypothetical protein [Breznakiella homolactica]|uniref:DUF2975 domain-containing protein n=1 Tax=Breznakiella homolactica TaxID=2798577 RepID=A0A7T7XM13_9SPIR|nr:hypothetical protein [Breznakiella homolactica]QQO08864.1 hypothetical protein JFL75_18335 [Breznakiella homolactica]
MILNYCIAVAVLALSFAGTVYISGGMLLHYLDLPSLLIMVFFPVVYQLLLFGSAAVKSAFTAGFRKDTTPEQAEKARLFFWSYSRTLWITAMVTVLIAVIAMLINLEDRTALGPNFALALISLLYAGLLHLAVVLPNLVFLRKRLIESNTEI